jgi:N-dimethylarginine dimethylaminohydrolase
VAALYETLRDLGVTIECDRGGRGPARPGVHGQRGLIEHDLFLSSRFRYGVRQGETPRFDRWFAAHGFCVETLPAGFHFEGAGDALFCGATLLAGYRFRTEARSLLWIGEHLGVEVLPLELVDPRYYHLDTCFCPLAEDEALYYPGAFDEYGRSVCATGSAA